MKKTTEGKGAWTVKVGEKGQFVIPKEARDMFGIKPGDSLLVLGDAERGLAIPPKGQIEKVFEDILRGEEVAGIRAETGTGSSGDKGGDK